jgi:hypothetical protein
MSQPKSNFPKAHFESLLNDALQLRVTWIMTKQLMSHSQARVDCMNYFAPAFFSTVLVAMGHFNTATVGRLLDTRRDVLSMPTLLNKLKKDLRSKEDDTKFALLDRQLSDLKIACAPIIARRHEVVGHSAKVEKLTPVLIKDMDAAVSSIGELLKTTAKYFGGFDQGGFDDNWYEREFGGMDANALMSFLETSAQWTVASTIHAVS